MHAEAQIGFVVAHAQRRRRDHGLELVVAQPSLDLFPRRGVELARVGGDGVAARVEVAGEALGLGDGGHVDDPGARQRGQRGVDPCVPLERPEAVDHRQPQRRACEAAPQHDRGVTELCRHVGRHPRVGGRGRGQDGSARRTGQHLREALVVGPEVEAPVRDAVRFVDDDQACAGDERRESACEARVGETFGRDEEHVDGAGVDVGQDAVPVVDVGGVDRDRPQPGSLGGGELVAHEGEQRRHDQRRAAAQGADRRGRGPVHRRLPPPGRLHHQHAGLVGDQCLDGPGLVLVRACGVARHRRQHRDEMFVGDLREVGALALRPRRSGCFTTGCGHRPNLRATSHRRAGAIRTHLRG